MRLRKYISFCLFGIILSGFKKDSITFDLTGRLKVKSGDDQIRISRVIVFVTGNNQMLDKAISNTKGIFHLSWNDNNARIFDFYCIIRNDTVALAKRVRFDSDTPDLTFIMPEHVHHSK